MNAMTTYRTASKSRPLATLIALIVLGIGAAQAGEVIKIASIAPKGSLYHRVLQEIGEAYRTTQGPGARAIIYANSLQGTEADTVRRMRVGQLDGSMLSVVGLSQIDPSVAALQFMPLMFRSWAEVDHVREQLRPELEEKLAAKGFVVLMWGEAGWVQFFTREPITHPEQFKRTRTWAWDGDPVQVDIMKSLGFRPVALPIGDILPGLETGMVDSVPVAPLWALVGQFDRVTRYMLPINWVPIVGATVFRKQRFDALRPEVRDAVMTAARAGAEKLRAHRALQDAESIRAMQARGLTVQAMTPEIEHVWGEVARAAWPQVRGSMVPAELFDKVRASLDAYRGQTK
jgi:TRAP-type C4-dicarboxylate transport system substrate-binding protein